MPLHRKNISAAGFGAQTAPYGVAVVIRCTRIDRESAVGLPVPHRCWKAQQLCTDDEPTLESRLGLHPGACHFAELPDTDHSATSPR